MPAKVTAHMGDVFEGGADLTMLPCGAKPSWTSAVGRWINHYGIPSPADLVDRMSLSDITPLCEFPGPKRTTQFVAYGASVFNDHTTPEAIRKLGENIGRVTRDKPEIRIVESVLFGTGYGGLDDVTATKALASGFKRMAAPSARLCIFVHSMDRYAVVKSALSGSIVARMKGALLLNPNIQGIGINLKKLFGWEK